MKKLKYYIALVVILHLFFLTISEASNNSELKNNLLKRITKIHPQWHFSKEKNIGKGKLLVMAQNPVYPVLKPVWLIQDAKIYSVNGAAKTLTADFQFTYDINPLDAIDIIEGKKSYKDTSDNKGNAWNTPQEALDVLKVHEFITEQEATIMRRFDKYFYGDSNETIEEWAKKNNISRSRITEIVSMRYDYKSIDEIRQAGYGRIGEKRQIKENGQPTGIPIKKFDVKFRKTISNIYIQVATDLPDGSPLTFDITKTGLKDEDKWIGNQAKTIVKNGKAEASIPLTTHLGEPLKKGNYDIEILFNSFWSAFHKDVAPNVKLKVGEFGENLKTSYNGIFENKGKKYRTINYRKKAAFSFP